MSRSPTRRRGTSAFPLARWADYFRTHAALIAISEAADVPTLRRIIQCCTSVGLSDLDADTIALDAFGYDARRIAESMRGLRSSELRFALLVDAYQMARAARIDAPEQEPALRGLSLVLDVSDEQQLAIARYVRACDAHVTTPWGDVLAEVNAALQGIVESGASMLAVTENRWISLRGGVEYASLVRLCRELTSSPLDSNPEKESNDAENEN